MNRTLSLSLSLSIPALIGALIAGAGPASAQDAAAGAKVFDIYCGACHTLTRPTASKPAPKLAGIIGRKAGSVPGYNASLAMKAFGKVWTPPLLDAYVANPGRLVPGSAMGVGVSDPKKRADLIAYLRQQK